MSKPDARQFRLERTEKSLLERLKKNPRDRSARAILAFLQANRARETATDPAAKKRAEEQSVVALGDMEWALRLEMAKAQRGNNDIEVAVRDAIAAAQKTRS